MAAMGRTGTKRLTFKKEGDFELVLERGEENWRPGIENSHDNPEDLFRAVNPFGKANEVFSKGSDLPPRVQVQVTETVKEESNSVYITSPMVGTFYATPSPEDPAFVKIGDKIDKNSLVCVIEAMKVMNEIKANVTGTIAEVLVDSGQPVEFGTKLFRVV